MIADESDFYDKMAVEAYADPISKIEPEATKKLNNGRVDALAREAGHNGPWETKWNKTAEIEKELGRAGVWK